MMMAVPAAAGDVAKGRALAEKHCARCHVVGEANKFGGIGSTPSLAWIKNLKDWRDRFETFYARRPHPAFIRVEGVTPPTKVLPYATPIELTVEDVENIVAFAVALPKPKQK